MQNGKQMLKEMSSQNNVLGSRLRFYSVDTVKRAIASDGKRSGNPTFAQLLRNTKITIGGK